MAIPCILRITTDITVVKTTFKITFQLWRNAILNSFPKYCLLLPNAAVNSNINVTFLSLCLSCLTRNCTKYERRELTLYLLLPFLNECSRHGMKWNLFAMKRNVMQKVLQVETWLFFVDIVKMAPIVHNNTNRNLHLLNPNKK